MADLFKRFSAIDIYGCPHDVVFCKRCQKIKHLNRRARRRLKRVTSRLASQGSVLPASRERRA